MAVAQNGQGSTFYRCRHRGEGCEQPARSTKGLARAAVLGLALIGRDERLQAAIRRQLASGATTAPEAPLARRGASPAATLAKLAQDRRKLLELYYADKISADGFAAEETRLCAAIETERARALDEQHEERQKNELELRFEQVAAVLQNLDVDAVWTRADDAEKRILVEELVEWVTVFPDHLEVTVTGTPALNVLYGEVGLKESDFVGVGGPIRQFCHHALAA